METKKGIILKKIIYVMALIMLNLIILFGVEFDNKSNIYLMYTLVDGGQDIYQTFYSTTGEWTEEMSLKQQIDNSDKNHEIEFFVPKDTKFIRLDFGNLGKDLKVDRIHLQYGWEKIDLYNHIINLDVENEVKVNNIKSIKEKNGVLSIEINGNDPYLILEIDSIIEQTIVNVDKYINVGMKIIACLVIIGILEVMRRKAKGIISLIQDINNNKKIMWKLAINDFKNKYTGSYLGIIWAFVHPVVIVTVYWFVFQVGFKSQPVDDFPFILWLVAGIVPWFFFNEAIMNATNAMLEYSYLVKKVVFKISILPIVKILSSLFVHLFFMAFTIILFMIYGYIPTVFTIQVIYYSVCLIVFILAITYFTSAVVIFFKDLNQIIAILLQVGMWATPIMWSYSMIPDKYQWILKLNPLYYIVEGYRDSLINQIWFWERYNQTIYFWVVTVILFIIGTLTFKRLKVHFADVL